MMYDWANSAHSVIVVTILPIFFDTVAGYTADSVSSMSTWGFATSLAMAIVALSAPFWACSAISAECAKSCSLCSCCLASLR